MKAAALFLIAILLLGCCPPVVDTWRRPAPRDPALAPCPRLTPDETYEVLARRFPLAERLLHDTQAVELSTEQAGALTGATLELEAGQRWVLVRAMRVHANEGRLAVYLSPSAAFVVHEVPKASRTRGSRSAVVFASWTLPTTVYSACSLPQ